MTTCGAMPHAGVGPVILDPRNAPDWNSRVLATAEAHVFHSVEWARVLLETYDWQPFYIQHQGALLPLIEARSSLTPRRGISLPFTDFCQPLGCGLTGFSDLFDAALQIGRSKKWKYVELRGAIELLDGATPSDQFYSHELDLESGPDCLFAGFSSPVRRAVRKAEQSGVTVGFGNDLESLQAFWRLHNLTRHKHGVPPQPFSFMRKIHEHLLLKDMGFVAVASHQGRPVAAGMFLHFGKQALYKFGASDSDLQHLRGSNAMFWAAIRHYAQRGFRSLHLGRTEMDNAGLRRFKLGWGAKETVLSYCRYDLVRGSFAGLREHRSHGLSARVFRAMPTPMLRLLGKILYRHAA